MCVFANTVIFNLKQFWHSGLSTLGGPTASGAAVACAKSSATASGTENRHRGCDDVVSKCSYNATVL